MTSWLLILIQLSACWVIQAADATHTQADRCVCYLMLRSWQPTAAYFLVGSTSMSYSVVFLTT